MYNQKLLSEIFSSKTNIIHLITSCTHLGYTIGGGVTGFLGSLKISRCEERRLEDTQNLKCEDKRFQNCLVLTTEDSATKPTKLED